MFPPVFDRSIIGRAQKNGHLSIRYINIRDFATDKHKSVDDKPFGGGVGMIMRIDIVHKALEQAIESSGINQSSTYKILMDPAGESYTQGMAATLTTYEHLILICGHYEGIDSRIYNFIDTSVSIGGYVLTGGEIPAMVIADSVARLIPGVLPTDATKYESFALGSQLEGPQYTRPVVYEDLKVPEILLSGNHKEIAIWKEKKSKERTEGKYQKKTN